MCGRPTHICQDAANEYAWKVDPPSRCLATTALRERQKGFTEETNPHLDALVWSVRLATAEEGS